MTTAHTPVPLPIGAVEAGEWEIGTRITRGFLNPARGTDKLSVGIVGEQDYCSGEVLRRTVLVCASGGHTSAVVDLDEAELREHIAAAQAIADEIRALADAEAE
jgi:hypothetical protein